MYREEYSKLSEEDKLKAFRSIIRRQGNCEFANNGQFDQTIIVEARERKLIACTDSGQIPVAHYNRQVVGETPL